MNDDAVVGGNGVPGNTLPDVRPDAAPRARRVRGERGQAAVEFALSLPLVVLLVLGIVQIALVARDRMAVELAAREAARAAAVSADPTTAANLAVERVTSLDIADVSVSVNGDTVTVTVRRVNPTDVAMIGPLIPDVDVTATVTMAFEPPPDS